MTALGEPARAAFRVALYGFELGGFASEHDVLIAEKERTGIDTHAIVRVEQFFPIPEVGLLAALEGYPNADEVRWVQEEPRNMGAWGFVSGRLRNLLPAAAQLKYVGRPFRASPAEGYPGAHAAAQAGIVAAAFEA